LSKLNCTRVETEAERWLNFLKEGDQLDPEHLPDWMQHPIMRQAMGILSRFSEKERDYHRYQSRQEALRVQRTIQRRLDEAIAEADAAREAEQAAREAEQTARAQEQAAREAEQAALAEIARLKALLNRSNRS
jgi:alkylation response protein AidB-like acyl-CoA dehydrogenase